MQSANRLTALFRSRSTLVRAVLGVAILTVIIALYLIVAAAQGLAPFSKSDTVQANVEILLDRSTVMEDLVGPDTSRLKEAIQSINVSVLAPEAAGADILALRQFGGPCDGDNTELLSDFKPDNRPKIKQAISAIDTGGETTLSDGLMAAISDFRNTTALGGGSKTIIVISGGAETCESNIDSAVIAQQLRDSDIKLSFIGINVSAEVQGNLVQVINGLGGIPFFATSSTDLENRLSRIMLEILEGRDALPTVDTISPIIAPTLASAPTPAPTVAPTPAPTVAPTQVGKGNTSGTTPTRNVRTERPAPPTVTIASPPTGTLLLTTDSISFTGSATDTEDGSLTGASLVWTSDVDGQLGTGGSISATLSAGAHNITLTATDSHQHQSNSSLSVRVSLPDTPPTVTIASPPTGTLLLTTDSISFTGSATDTEDGSLTGASLVWTSDVDGQLGTGGSISVTLSAGAHNITLTATDSHQNQGSSSLSVIVTVPQPPGDCFATSVGTPPYPGQTLPHIFVGTVEIDGVPPPDGVAVSAWVEGNLAAAASVNGGRYTLKIGPPYGVSYAGKTVQFNIGECAASQTAEWQAGGANLLDITGAS